MKLTRAEFERLAPDDQADYQDRYGDVFIETPARLSPPPAPPPEPAPPPPAAPIAPSREAKDKPAAPNVKMSLADLRANTAYFTGREVLSLLTCFGVLVIFVLLVAGLINLELSDGEHFYLVLLAIFSLAGLCLNYSLSRALFDIADRLHEKK